MRVALYYRGIRKTYAASRSVFDTLCRYSAVSSLRHAIVTHWPVLVFKCANWKLNHIFYIRRAIEESILQTKTGDNVRENWKPIVPWMHAQWFAVRTYGHRTPPRVLVNAHASPNSFRSTTSPWVIVRSHQKYQLYHVLDVQLRQEQISQRWSIILETRLCLFLLPVWCYSLLSLRFYWSVNTVRERKSQKPPTDNVGRSEWSLRGSGD